MNFLSQFDNGKKTMRTVTHARKYYNVGGRNFSVENLICNLDWPKLYDPLERSLPYASKFPLFYNTAGFSEQTLHQKPSFISNQIIYLDGAQ